VRVASSDACAALRASSQVPLLHIGGDGRRRSRSACAPDCTAQYIGGLARELQGNAFSCISCCVVESRRHGSWARTSVATSSMYTPSQRRAHVPLRVRQSSRASPQVAGHDRICPVLSQAAPDAGPYSTHVRPHVTSRHVDTLQLRSGATGALGPGCSCGALHAISRSSRQAQPSHQQGQRGCAAANNLSRGGGAPAEVAASGAPLGPRSGPARESHRAWRHRARRDTATDHRLRRAQESRTQRVRQSGAAKRSTRAGFRRVAARSPRSSAGAGTGCSSRPGHATSLPSVEMLRTRRERRNGEARRSTRAGFRRASAPAARGARTRA